MDNLYHIQMLEATKAKVDQLTTRLEMVEKSFEFFQGWLGKDLTEGVVEHTCDGANATVVADHVPNRMD